MDSHKVLLRTVGIVLWGVELDPQGRIDQETRGFRNVPVSSNSRSILSR